MAEVKISELTSATTPLAGTETVPIVQGGVTKKVAFSEFAGFQQEMANITSNGNNAYIQQGFSSNTPQDINLIFESRAIGLFKNYKHIFTKFANISSLSLATGSGITTFNYNNEFFAGVNFPSGTFTYNIDSKVIGSCNNPSAGTINFPNLTLLNSVLTVGSATVTANNLIACTGVGINGTTAYGLNSLEAIAGTLQFVGTPSPTFSIVSNMPALKYIQTVQSNANSMTSINLDGALYIQSVSLFPGTNPSLLTTFSFANIKELGGNFQTSTTIGLNQTSVDHILVKLASLDGTNGTCFYGNRTVTVRGAAPSATGLAAKATLISRGCSVTTS
jgi:hypothetical protein